MLAGTALAALLMAPATSSVASQNIAWTWNSGDRDSRARFVAEGDDYQGQEVNGNNYVDWAGGGAGSGRWFIPGSATNTVRTLNLSMSENKKVTLKVCEEKGAWPDDCSSTKSGVS